MIAPYPRVVDDGTSTPDLEKEETNVLFLIDDGCQITSDEREATLLIYKRIFELNI